MREKIMRFMYGRYGTDKFSQFLLGVSVVFLVISMFSRSSIWYTLVLVLMVYTYFRMFSKNHAKRYAENQKFLQMTSGIRQKWQTFQRDNAQRKTHHIYKCPTCGQKIRVPKGKGKIEVTCPKCKGKFVRKS